MATKGLFKSTTDVIKRRVPNKSSYVGISHKILKAHWNVKLLSLKSTFFLLSYKHFDDRTVGLTKPSGVSGDRANLWNWSSGIGLEY